MFFSKTSFRALRGGLKRTYRRGRTGRKRAFAAPTTERLHEWRKRVKYHWYHVRLLQNVWPEPMKVRRRELKVLADLLGDDHDLAVLRQLLLSAPEQEEARPRSQAEPGNETGLVATATGHNDPGEVVGLLDRRRLQLQGQARLLGPAGVCRAARRVREADRPLVGGGAPGEAC